MIEMLPPPEDSKTPEDQSTITPLGSEASAPTPSPNKQPGDLSDGPGLQFRELTESEIASVEHIFAETGNPLPDPAISTFVGAVDPDGKVLAFLVLQLKLHAQPLWIADGHSALLTSLVAEAERTILRKTGAAQWVYLFAPAGRLAQLGQAMGMGLEPWVVLSKLVLPEVPAQGPVELVPTPANPGQFHTQDPQDAFEWEPLFPKGTIQ